MMGKMRVYDSSKPTEIGWLPFVPSHWDVVDIKRCFSFPKEIVGSDFNNYKVLSLSVNGVIFRDMESGAGKHHSDMGTYQIIRPNSIVLCLFDMDVTPRIVGHSDKTGIITSAYVNIVPKENINSKYYYYYFLLQDFNKYLFSQGTGIRTTLTRGQFGALKIVLPNYEEQIAIARFLDYKLSKINRFIRKKKQLIQLLNEQKAAIINQAVTKGLDPNAPMKDSGVEWLGEIPEHWEVRRLKFLIRGKLKYGANEPGGNFILDAPRYIRITDFDNNGNLKSNTICSLEFTLAEPYLLKEGDILFARSGGTVGKTFQFKNYNGQACYAGYLIKAEPNLDKILSDYLFIYTNSGVYNQWKNFIFNKATIENIGADKYANLPVIVPKPSEQLQIVAHIETETALLTTTISKIEKEIALVEEYKTALIAEAVTGKIDVRGYAIPEIDVETWHAMSQEEEEELSMSAEDAAEYQTEETE
ncbi:MAG: restriction endonuclease subunit S [Bacteroidetes bacterium]|nr:restriction endonuclease subunit S [Bacteroidota bacterium]